MINHITPYILINLFLIKESYLIEIVIDIKISLFKKEFLLWLVNTSSFKKSFLNRFILKQMNFVSVSLFR